jgi:hypothetical protein
MLTCCMPACSPRLKSHMEYCMAHPEEISKIAAVQKRVSNICGSATGDWAPVSVTWDRRSVQPLRSALQQGPPACGQPDPQPQATETALFARPTFEAVPSSVSCWVL